MNLVPDGKQSEVLRCEEYDRWHKECADEGVTLVKDKEKLLPISPVKHKRILFQMMGDFPSNERVYEEFTELLSTEGFEIIKYEPEDFSKPLDSVEEFKRKYDLVVYCANIETASNKTVSRLNWYTFFGQGNNMPWFVKEVPTMFISVGNPYHLMDAQWSYI
jgi:beta-N-acetylhexosaminidase